MCTIAKGGIGVKPISQEQAREIFLQSDAKYISQEQSYIFYDLFSGCFELETYLCDECLVVKKESEWFIHALSERSDLVSAAGNVQAVRTDTDRVFAFSYGAPPGELNGRIGSHKFFRKGFSYFDPDIRKLTPADREQVAFCCADDPADNRTGREMASDFLRRFADSAENLLALGLFDGGKLVGYVQGDFYAELEMTTCDLYVNRLYRRKGYAKRLLSAFCATRPEGIFCYSCVASNAASAATAKAVGFRYAGSYLWIA